MFQKLFIWFLICYQGRRSKSHNKSLYMALKARPIGYSVHDLVNMMLYLTTINLMYRRKFVQSDKIWQNHKRKNK